MNVIPTIYTAAGEPFTKDEHAFLAYLLWKRVGYNTERACAAWNTLLQNDTSPAGFEGLARRAIGLSPSWIPTPKEPQAADHA